jgi:hypothetical protein
VKPYDVQDLHGRMKLRWRKECQIESALKNAYISLLFGFLAEFNAAECAKPSLDAPINTASLS